ncbi:MAG TPA: HEAT repeat domain-containing protein [Terracidiphilus sp.]|nr:HEAT repeat domain-containing protein [Terracidiphilus sp.]
MNCEVAQERIVTAAYRELPDEQVHELERHLASCPDCGQEREQLQALKVLANAYPVLEPGPNLIARSRLRLEEALDALPPMRWYERLAQRTMNNFASLQAAPVAAVLLLLVGGGIGSLTGFEYAQNRAATSARAAAPATDATAPATAVDAAQAAADAGAGGLASVSNVANVVSIQSQPNSQMVEVRYSRLVPEEVEGSLNDPAIRQLLMLASEDAASAGVRDDSVALMAAACRSGDGCQTAGIRDALMVALRYDQSASVRMKALEGLEPYVSRDLRVRDAVLEALLDDADPGIRSAAIGVLEPVEADTSVRQVLSTVATSDESPRIRLVSRAVLSRAPEIQ